jgi:hypothetical protein
MNIKKIINNYDFAKADFDNLPKDIFQINRNKLPEDDRVILDGIKFQLMVSKANNISQYINYSNMIKTVSTGITLTVIGFLLISLAYYLNVRFSLGLSIMNDVFAQENTMEQNVNSTFKTSVSEITTSSDHMEGYK